MTIHNTSHPLAGQTVILNTTAVDPVRGIVTENAEYRIEDYWDRVSGQSWKYSSGNIAAMQYALRAAYANLPMDDEVVYGKIDGFGHLVHVSELGS